MIRLLLALCANLVSVHAMAQRTIPAYNTYQSVPFVAEGNTGLAADLVAYLNTKLEGKYVLQLQTIPRERLNRIVLAEPDFQGVVLLLSPQFVGDSEMTKFTWTPPIMTDVNIVISSVKKNLEYTGPESLVGMRFVGVRGHRYAGLEERFGTEIQRENVTNELQALRMITSDRADATVMARSTFNYLNQVHTNLDEFRKTLFISSTPHLNFVRAMFVSKHNVTFGQNLSQVVSRMRGDSEWKSILTKYGIQ